MGHIREPKGVIFVTKSEPLPESARKKLANSFENTRISQL